MGRTLLVSDFAFVDMTAFCFEDYGEVLLMLDAFFLRLGQSSPHFVTFFAQTYPHPTRPLLPSSY